MSASLVIEIFLGTGDKECSALVELVEATKIDIATIHDVEGRWFEDELIENPDIVSCALGDADEARDRATQVHKGVQFDRSFALAKMGPRKE